MLTYICVHSMHAYIPNYRIQYAHAPRHIHIYVHLNSVMNQINYCA